MGEKQNHSWVGARKRHSNKEMSKEILITDCWMPIESCIHRQLQQDSVHSVFFYSFKSSLHMQPARTAFEISGASRWFPNIHLCGCGKNLFSQACNYKKDIFIYSHDEVFVLDDYMEKKKKKGCSECVLGEAARWKDPVPRGNGCWLTDTGRASMEVGPRPAVFVATRPDVFKETFPAVLVATQSGYCSRKLGQPRLWWPNQVF